MSDSFILEIPEMVGMPPAAKRKAQASNATGPPTIIVSADSHMLERDCWRGKFPPELREQRPRIELKGVDAVFDKVTDVAMAQRILGKTALESSTCARPMPSPQRSNSEVDNG